MGYEAGCRLAHLVYLPIASVSALVVERQELIELRLALARLQWLSAVKAGLKNLLPHLSFGTWLELFLFRRRRSGSAKSDGSTDEFAECRLIERVIFVNVDGTTHLRIETGVE